MMLTLLIRKERRELSARYHQSQKTLTCATYPNMIDVFYPSTGRKIQKKRFFLHERCTLYTKSIVEYFISQLLPLQVFTH